MAETKKKKEVVIPARTGNSQANNQEKPSPRGFKLFEMRIWSGVGIGHYIIGGGAYYVTIRDLSTGQSTWYDMQVVGLGIGLPVVRLHSLPVRFIEDDSKTSDSFEGRGRIGSASFEAVIGGFKLLGGIWIPNGPFIPHQYLSGSLGWEKGGFDIGVSYNAMFWQIKHKKRDKRLPKPNNIS
jgi:hypothetical protein